MSAKHGECPWAGAPQEGICLEVRPGVCAQDRVAWVLSCFPTSPSPRPHSPRLNFLVGMDGAFSGPGWGADLPDQLSLLCLPLLKDPTAFPVPTFQDLAGFWDLLQLSIEDVTLKFLELQQLKANSWKLLEPKVGGESLQAKRPDPGKCPFPQRPVWGEEGSQGHSRAAKAVLDP